jgi:methionyl-tRNA formyltransferase
MKLVYLGSPEAAVAPLQALVVAGHDVVLVVSQPDRRRGRGSSLSPSPVKAAALDLGLPVTDNVNDVLGAVRAGAELGVVVAYGRLIRRNLLDAVPFVNLHFSLLPKWRGAAPVERSLLAGDTETGVCLMALEEGLDTGAVYRRVATQIGPDECANDLRARLVGLGTEMLVGALENNSVAGLGEPVPQSGEASWAAKLEPSEFEIDWVSSGAVLDRLTRVRPIFTTFRGKRIKIHTLECVEVSVDSGSGVPDVMKPGTVVRVDPLEIATGDSLIRPVVVQPEGKGPMSATDWRNGAQPVVGERFGASS